MSVLYKRIRSQPASVEKNKPAFTIYLFFNKRFIGNGLFVSKCSVVCHPLFADSITRGWLQVMYKLHDQNHQRNSFKTSPGRPELAHWIRSCEPVHGSQLWTKGKRISSARKWALLLARPMVLAPHRWGELGPSSPEFVRICLGS